MSKQRWHIIEAEGGLTLARHLPPRFDVVAETWLPDAAPQRMARQIRQDLWRALQRVRGFSPVVELRPDGSGWRVRAGGRLAGPVPGNVEDTIACVLGDHTLRLRWVTHARRTRRAREEVLDNKSFTSGGDFA